MNRNQHLTKATKDIAVSVINSDMGSGGLAESAIILNFGKPNEKIVGIQIHGRLSKDGRRKRTNRAIACQIARQIRRREARKQA